VDALFIPDYYDVVSVITPFLAYYDIKDIILLGSNGWNSPKLSELGGKYVEGAIIVDGFFSGSSRKETKEFVKRFKEVYGYEPGILEAQAYDAAIMLFSSLGEDPIDRDILRGRLMTMSIEGASGKISFDSDGEARKELFLLTVKNGEIVELR
jgi:ABC-type branched-subunit amino acid transport system substrate-binding protein